MTDDEIDAAFKLATRPCSDCGIVTSPYQLVEVRLQGRAVRWLCRACRSASCGV